MLQSSVHILSFAEAKKPTYHEMSRKGYLQYGDDNSYPDYLIGLYNDSAKHGAIIRSKIKYITGSGWNGTNELFINAPNEFETLYDLTRKVTTDLEIFGGCYIEVIWSVIGGYITSISHISYNSIRTNKDNTQYWYKKDWKDNKEKEEIIPAFNPELREGKQIFYLKEYNPIQKAYSLPSYIGALNFIESDIHISKHTLGNAMSGFSASKMITLVEGEPTDDEKKEVEKKFEKKYTGADGRKFILSFVNDATRKPIVEDLGASDLSKEDFSSIDSMIQQNIYAGHEITSPSLFGIAEPGKLGTRTEMRDAYEIFKNTYVNYKQRLIESTFNMFVSYIENGIQDLSIQPVEPITYEFSEQTLVSNLTKDELRDKLGLPPMDVKASSGAQAITDAINAMSPLVANKVLESMSTEEIRSLVGLTKSNAPAQIDPTTGMPIQQEQQPINENIKNLTGRQHQQILRIIRQYGQGKITREVAVTLLKTGLGLSESDIDTLLGSNNTAQFSKYSEEEVIEMFNACGVSADEFEILLSKEMTFEEQFIDAKITSPVDTKIIEILNKNPLATNEEIGRALKITKEEVAQRINQLTKNNIVSINKKTGTRELNKPVSDIVKKSSGVEFKILYSYEWDKSRVPSGMRDKTTSRPFCQKLMSMNKLWTRKEIETLSNILGYSVFDRAGGWWTMPNGSHSPQCRHTWISNVVVKKK